jgi:hypothetical protein
MKLSLSRVDPPICANAAKAVAKILSVNVSYRLRLVFALALKAFAGVVPGVGLSWSLAKARVVGQVEVE